MKVCPVCKKEVVGRRDKVYCSPSCKSSFQYEQRLEQDSFFFEVDRQLKKNRSILRRYNQVGKTTLRKEVLLQEGFKPRFFTHYWKNGKGDVYLFCYEYGFLSRNENGKEKYVLVTWQPYMNS
ncbi:hypothetical protein [Cesiribacter sp. SM1]|uniref:hypothetical protein n=1 Tax=Cesiribacter sp. SM1 TaxID=2861196 RepID=UPI001CD5964E|nr:hypothetical protein [Cesiribacter sp. SM1]